MQISLNDKRVFIVLGFFGLAVIYYNFIYINQQKDIKKYTKSIASYEQISAQNDGVAIRIAGIDSELKIFNEKIKNIRSMFPPEISQDDVLILMKKFSEESGFSIKNITLSQVKEISGGTAPSAIPGNTSATGTAPKTEAKADTGNQSDAKSSGAKASSAKASSTKTTGKKTAGAKTTDTETTSALPSQVITDKRLLTALDSLGIAYGGTLQPVSGNTAVADGKGFALAVNISGTSNNKQLKDFLYMIQSFKNKTSINNVQVNSNNDGLLSVNMGIEFLGIADKKAAQQGKFFDVEWTPLDPANKSNIFKPFEGYMAPDNQSGSEGGIEKSDSKEIKQQKGSYDFSMRVLSFGDNMAPPTVSLVGKSIPAGENRIPIVYGDNREIEKVDLYIETKDGKFYCKFRTDHEAFPEATYMNLAQFEPIGDEIKMLVDSSKRVSTSDNAGVTMTITNKTKKNLVIDVVNDDSNRPRVAINKSGNNVIINYK